MPCCRSHGLLFRHYTWGDCGKTGFHILNTTWRGVISCVGHTLHLLLEAGAVPEPVLMLDPCFALFAVAQVLPQKLWVFAPSLYLGFTLQCWDGIQPSGAQRQRVRLTMHKAVVGAVVELEDPAVVPDDCGA